MIISKRRMRISIFLKTFGATDNNVSKWSLLNIDILMVAMAVSIWLGFGGFFGYNPWATDWEQEP